jgi:hypothetical protein
MRPVWRAKAEIGGNVTPSAERRNGFGGNPLIPAQGGCNFIK